MKPNRRAVLALSVLIAVAGPAAADTFPARAIDLIIPQPPGGSTDFSGRVLADGLSQIWGVPVRAVNMPGGNTIPAVTHVESAKPDGYTVFLDGGSSSSMLPIVMPERDNSLAKRTFLGMFSESPMIFVVAGTSEIDNLAELVAAVQADPKNFSWITNGGTGVGDLAFSQLFAVAGVDKSVTLPVAAPGGAPAAGQVAGGHVMAAAGSVSSIAGFVQSGDVKAIAVLGGSRVSSMPDVPTATEEGNEIMAVQWGAVSAPAGLPPEVVAEWQRALLAVQADPAVTERLSAAGIGLLSGGTPEVEARIAAETETMKKAFQN